MSRIDLLLFFSFLIILFLSLFLLPLTLTACAPSPPPPIATLAPQTPADELTFSPTVEPPCFWNWSRYALPDLVAEVQAALDAAEVADGRAKVRAEVYGEDCIDAETNTVRYFVAKETDYYFTLPADDLEDHEALGHLALEVLEALESFPAESTPGPQPGYIGINFVAGEEELRLWFTETRAVDALTQGLTGMALFEALAE